MKNKLIEYKKILLEIKRLLVIDYIEKENEKRFESVILTGKPKVKVKSRW